MMSAASTPTWEVILTIAKKAIVSITKSKKSIDKLNPLWYNKIRNQAKEIKTMTMNSYTVYNKKTSQIVAQGEYAEIEEYIDDDRYVVVWDFTGYVL